MPGSRNSGRGCPGWHRRAGPGADQVGPPPEHPLPELSKRGPGIPGLAEDGEEVGNLGTVADNRGPGVILLLQPVGKDESGRIVIGRLDERLQEGFFEASSLSSSSPVTPNFL